MEGHAKPISIKELIPLGDYGKFFTLCPVKANCRKCKIPKTFQQLIILSCGCFICRACIEDVISKESFFPSSVGAEGFTALYCKHHKQPIDFSEFAGLMGESLEKGSIKMMKLMFKQSEILKNKFYRQASMPR